MKNKLTIPEQYIPLLFANKQRRKGTVKNYPYQEYTAFRETTKKTIRIRQKICLAENNTKYKTYTVPVITDKNEITLPLETTKGETVYIPQSLVEKIYSFYFQIRSKWEAGESINSILKPNPIIKNFLEKEYLRFSKTEKINLKKYFLSKWKTSEFVVTNTIENYGEFKIKDVLPFTINIWIKDITNKKSASSARKTAYFMRQMFAAAVEIGYIEKNPFDHRTGGEPTIKIPNYRPEEKTPAIPLEILSGIIDTARETNPELYHYILLLYYTGLRSGDILNLTYNNIIDQDGIKIINLMESKLQGHASRTNTFIPVHPVLNNEVISKSPGGYIFKYSYSRRKNSVIPRLCRKFKDINPDYTPRQLRHTFITQLNNAGVSWDHIRCLTNKLPEGSFKNYLDNDTRTMHKNICKLPDITRSETSTRQHIFFKKNFSLKKIKQKKRRPKTPLMPINNARKGR